MTYNKYGNRKTVVDNVTFASKAEAGRYQELKILLKLGAITKLELQPIFILQVGFQLNNVKYRAITYVADFSYYENGKNVVEDVKGMRTDTYKIKKKLFLYRFPKLIFREV